MFRISVLLMILVPALEIFVLISIGKLIGGWPTFLLIMSTGFVGAFLAKREFRRVWQDARDQLSSGIIPGRSLLDGICIFAGGLLLLTPGFITDITGFLLLFPVTRPIFRHVLYRWMEKKVRQGSFKIIYKK